MSKKELKSLFKVAYTHNGVTINYCLIRDDYPTETFIDSLTKDQAANVAALFKLFCDKKGVMNNGQKFKKLEKYCVAILEFKTHQIRLAGFWRDGFKFNLIYGLIKKRDDWPANDIAAMRKNYDSFIAEENSRSKVSQGIQVTKGNSKGGKK